MLSRVAAVKAPRTHNRRRVTGSSGRRREGGESEPQRPNMSRHLFYSAVLLLVVMMCCGTGGAAKAEDDQSSDPKFEWKKITEDGVTVDSLGAPGLLKVGNGVFAVAEAQCKKGGDTVFTGIASQLLSMEKGNEPEEVLKDAKEKTQVLEEGTSGKKKKVDVSRPTTVVTESSIYMLVGKYCREGVDTCQAGTENIKSGILLVKGELGEADKKIDWKTTDGVPCTLGDQHKSFSQLIGGGGSGVKLTDDTLLFPVESTKKDGTGMDVKTVSLIIYSSKEVTNWNLSKGASEGGCSVPSVVEWKDKLMMMTACDDGRRRVYEIGDKGDSWTEALGTLSRVWGNRKGNEKAVGSGFITAKIGDGVDDNKKNVMLVTLPVYSNEKGNKKSELRLWLTDNTHIVDIGPVSREDEDVAASSLLHKSGDDNNEELIALYEKKGAGATPSLGMVSVLLTEQLQRVKDVLTTWKEVDGRVSKLCPSENAKKSPLSETACSPTFKITNGLVGFLSGNFSDGTWKDEYLGVNATVTKEDGVAEMTDNGVTFRGAWAEWPVGKQGENQLYHFANYNFTLVATVSIHEAPKEGSIPLIGVKINDGGNNPVLLGLSYNRERKWQVLCSGQTTTEHSSNWEPQTQYQVAIVLQNEKQGSAYVDGKSVGDESCVLKIADSKEISHFYIGGDGGNAENTGSREGVSVTVTNVLLYNRLLGDTEITALAKNKISIPKPEDRNELAGETDLPAVSGSDLEGTVSLSNAAGQKPLEEEPLKENVGGGAGGVSSAASVATTPSSDVEQTAATRSGDTMRGNGLPQTPEESVSSGEDEETVGGTDEQGEEGIHSQDRDVNATALNNSLVNLSQGNNSDGGTMRGSRLLPSLLLLLGIWVFAAL
ncbi:trans-sialidase [Trypanosoma cruzi Dm28c]|uniref:Trans-sialidase n=2 Tax=Trypanosoma cruzi TaxID=5693 RepID=V5AJI1_TRYCR|nr:trans-sialidase [Trypanosoma cruzi Dm28c]PBJ81464.1 trans-sialidase [Trypanosoma cruzi cruzi]PWU90120.1 putative trans-sialidase [Trypanosoma cruzi]